MRDHVNEEWLRRLGAEIGEDTVDEVIAIFVDETREAAGRLPSLVGRDAAEMLHFLAGSAANLGFADLETAARDCFARTDREGCLDVLARRFEAACSALEGRVAA